METLNDIQFQILDSLYFVESFESILEDVDGQKYVVADELKELIHQGLVQVMDFDEEAKDYVKSIFYDSDDMSAYFYLITKDGLLKHNGS